MYTACLLIALVTVSSVNALICDPARYPWAGMANAQPSFTITQPTPLQSYTKGLQGTLLITGSIKVIDGCTFEMVNIGVQAAVQAAQLQWLGSLTATAAVAVTVSDQTFYSADGQFPDRGLFTLTSASGRQVSWYDVTVMKLFSQEEQNSYATVTLSGGNMTVPAIGEAIKSPAPAAPAGVTQAPLLSGGTVPTQAAAATTAAASPAAAVSPAGGSYGSPSSATTTAASAKATNSASTYAASSFAAVFIAVVVALLL